MMVSGGWDLHLNDPWDLHLNDPKKNGWSIEG